MSNLKPLAACTFVLFAASCAPTASFSGNYTMAGQRATSTATVPPPSASDTSLVKAAAHRATTPSLSVRTNRAPDGVTPLTVTVML